MTIVKESDIPWVERRSPRGRFHLFRCHLSQALGAPPDTGVAGGGHPFEVELTRLPPGAANFPPHSHTVQWELYIVRGGTGELRTSEETVTITAGDVFVCPPGDVHQLKNTGSEDLLYYVIADNPPADAGFFPNSNKWFLKPQRKSVTLHEVDYYAGEE